VSRALPYGILLPSIVWLGLIVPRQSALLAMFPDGDHGFRLTLWASGVTGMSARGIGCLALTAATLVFTKSRHSPEAQLARG
jgi:hypothetical protein